jgi:hypothetical protein
VGGSAELRRAEDAERLREDLEGERAELMTEIAGLIEIITSNEPQIVDGECH